MVKVTTFLAVLCFLLALGLGQVLALTWDFDKEADVEDWEGLQAQRKTCKWTIDLKGGVFQAEGLADEGTAFVKGTVCISKLCNFSLIINY